MLAHAAVAVRSSLAWHSCRTEHSVQPPHCLMGLAALGTPEQGTLPIVRTHLNAAVGHSIAEHATQLNEKKQKVLARVAAFEMTL